MGTVIFNPDNVLINFFSGTAKLGKEMEHAERATTISVFVPKANEWYLAACMSQVQEWVKSVHPDFVGKPEISGESDEFIGVFIRKPDSRMKPMEKPEDVDTSTLTLADTLAVRANGRTRRRG